MRVYLFICIVMFGLIDFSLQIAKIEGNCANDITNSNKRECNHIFCGSSPGEPYSILPCGLKTADCGPGKTFVGTKFDDEKEYPDCCVQIICE